MRTAPIHLDSTAATPLDPRVLDAMPPYLAVHDGSPSPGHGGGRETSIGARASRTA